ncbi:MAG: hypothetical protein QOH43_4827 [Solirubrobacteraceae bacterium]|nr:hypothetical protein [Solirubrobacteraceae bacterium]
MPRAACLGAATVLAFFAGGYFARPQAIALVVFAAVLAVAALAAPAPLPTGGAARGALAALGALCAWTALSASWAPLRFEASGDARRVLLYLVAFATAVAVWRPRAAARWVEPGLAAGIVVVLLGGLAGRLVPGIIVQNETTRAGARLEQPLTYWNAEGVLAAMGLLLCLRLAGDAERPRSIRIAAAAGTVPLAVGLYLTFSRGALLAFAAGLIVLVVAAGTRSQLRAIAACSLPCLAAIVAAGRSSSVRVLDGNQAVKEHQGALVLAALMVAVAAAVLLAWLATRHERRTDHSRDRLRLPRWTAAVVAVVVVALVAVPVAVGGGRAPTTRPDAAYGATNQRLVDLGSNRNEYWRVALAVWVDHPVAGVGSSGYAVQWFQRRRIGESLHDAHSIELETLAELGLVGAAFLAALLGSVALAARRVNRADRALAAGPIAALVTWLVHASLDWDWEMPAVTLVAVVLAGMLVARADAREPAGRSA